VAANGEKEKLQGDDTEAKSREFWKEERERIGGVRRGLAL
jgi:hypothetical protein